MKDKIIRLTKIAVITGLYVALTCLVPFSYEMIQIRISEVLIILCLFKKDYIISITLGCLISNLFSPFGIYDCAFGSVATLLGALSVAFIKCVPLGLFLNVISNGLIVGFEISFLNAIPFGFSFCSVFIGELIVMIIAYCIYRIIRNKKEFLNIIE